MSNINPNDPAMPYDNNGYPGTTGLTIRQEFAARMMAACRIGDPLMPPSMVADLALKDADALIAALQNSVTNE